MTFKLVSILVAVTLSATVAAEPPARVEKQGQASKTKIEATVAGHLSGLNGKYKLRASEVTYAPGGFIGPHHHAGPGVRCVTAGELTYIQPDRTTIYRQGDCFFESGDVSHTAKNETGKPVVLLNFEVLPVDWSAGSAIPVPK
ncbi:cupin domain-containing protein [Rudaea sp.]|uniref:cupin domain-containing protein n=1 Tax=Rudaea sp. TaxID=2136325 RepID=UPI002ED253C7